MSPTRSAVLKRFARSASENAALLAIAAIALVPIVVMVINSFKSTSEIFATPLSLPSHLSADNYVNAWQQSNFGTYLVNSVIVTSGSLVLIVVSSALVSYVLARHEFAGSNAIYLFFMLGLVIPIRLAAVPLLVILKGIGLINTLPGLMIVYAASGLPFSVFLMTNYLRNVPRDLDDAARIDGASELAVLWRVIVPISLPGIAVVAMFNLVQVWNDYFLPLLLIQNPDLRTIPLGIAAFFGEHQTQWDLVFAGLTMSAIPIIFMFVILSRPFVRGITTGAIK